MTGTPLTPVADWDAVRATPEGAALADAYLTLRQHLQTLIVLTQAADTGTGMSVAALRTHADTLIPLLDEPNGKRWTAEYVHATNPVTFGTAKVREYLANVPRGYRQDFLLEFALEAYERTQP